jgi:precorrin-6B methylase 1
MDGASPNAGSLTVVGSGIKAVAHLTREAEARIRSADKVLYLVTEPISARFVASLNPNAESLADLYHPTQQRASIYESIVSYVLEHVRQGLAVCVVLYGHPGVFAIPGHEAVRQARASGHRAEMIPGISAEDCLFADIGLDPGTQGLQSYEATDFILRPREFDVFTPLVLWQVGVVGQLGYPPGSNGDALELLARRLRSRYGPDHAVTLYEASEFPIGRARTDRVRLAALSEAELSPLTTLYVPPLSGPA